MKVWVVTNGIYEDEKIIGVAQSAAEADLMVVNAKLSGKFRDNDYDVYGPLEFGQLYDWKGEKL